MSDLNDLLKPQLVELAEKILEIDVLSADTKDDIVKKIEDCEKENKESLISAYLVSIQEDEKSDDFDLEAYEKVVFLTLDKLLRKGKSLGEKAQKELDDAKKIAYAQDGKKALKTETYKVGHLTIRLVEGLPTPDSVIRHFSTDAQKILFS